MVFVTVRPPFSSTSLSPPRHSVWPLSLPSLSPPPPFPLSFRPLFPSSYILSTLLPPPHPHSLYHKPLSLSSLPLTLSCRSLLHSSCILSTLLLPPPSYILSYRSLPSLLHSVLPLSPIPVTRSVLLLSLPSLLQFPLPVPPPPLQLCVTLITLSPLCLSLLSTLPLTKLCLSHFPPSHTLPYRSPPPPTPGLAAVCYPQPFSPLSFFPFSLPSPLLSFASHTSLPLTAPLSVLPRSSLSSHPFKPSCHFLLPLSYSSPQPLSVTAPPPPPQPQSTPSFPLKE